MSWMYPVFFQTKGNKMIGKGKHTTTMFYICLQHSFCKFRPDEPRHSGHENHSHEHDVWDGLRCGTTWYPKNLMVIIFCLEKGRF